jgi:hypothetical protein
LLLYILESPQDPEAGADAQLLKQFGCLVKQMQDGGDFQMSNLVKACLGLEQLANAAISQANSASLTGAELPQGFLSHAAQVKLPFTSTEHDSLTYLYRASESC